MVPFVGVFTSLMVSLAIKIYLTYFCAQGMESPAFEAWCRGRPLVAAFFCPRSDVGALLEWLKAALEKREFVNVEGPFPWAHYRIRLTVEALDDCVVGVRLSSCGVLRGEQTRPALMSVWKALDASGLGVAELWLHRDLYSDGTVLDREETWRGSPVEGAWFEFRSFPELPFWLRRFDRRGPPDRREPLPVAVEPQGEPLLGGIPSGTGLFPKSFSREWQRYVAFAPFDGGENGAKIRGAGGEQTSSHKEHAMKVFGHPMSTCTRKVLCTLAEKNADHQFVLVDLAKGEHKGPEHLARQPFGVVPAIEDDGFSMFESRAIIRYLDAKLPGASLTPSDLKARAVMEQWISVEQSYFTPKAMSVIYETLFNPMMYGKPTDPEKLASGRAAVTQVCEILDKHLAGRDFFAGEFSLADICYAPYVEYLFAGKQGDLITNHKNLASWWGRVSERASWQKAIGK